VLCGVPTARKGGSGVFLPIFGPDGAALQADIRPFSGIAIERQVFNQNKGFAKPATLDGAEITITHNLNKQTGGPIGAK